MEKKIKIVVVGGLGKAGNAVLNQFAVDNKFEVVAIIDFRPTVKSVENVRGHKYPGIPVYDVEQGAICELSNQVDYFIDFTSATSAYSNSNEYIKHGANFIMCSSGLNVSQQDGIRMNCEGRGIKGAILANAAPAAVLAMYIDKLAAKFLNYHVFIEETHDKSKEDMPSGTAYKTLVECAKVRGFNDFDNLVLSGTNLKNSDYVVHPDSGIEIKAYRPQTTTTEQKVSFMAPEETLVIHHLAFNKGIYKRGVEMAIDYLQKNGGFIIGLEEAMGLPKI